MRTIESTTDDEADGAGTVNDDDDDRVRGRRFFIVIFVVLYVFVENKFIAAPRKMLIAEKHTIMPRKRRLIAENTEKKRSYFKIKTTTRANDHEQHHR